MEGKIACEMNEKVKKQKEIEDEILEIEKSINILEDRLGYLKREYELVKIDHVNRLKIIYNKLNGPYKVKYFSPPIYRNPKKRTLRLSLENGKTLSIAITESEDYQFCETMLLDGSDNDVHGFRSLIELKEYIEEVNKAI
jgi:hypothetical protein